MLWRDMEAEKVEDVESIEIKINKNANKQIEEMENKLNNNTEEVQYEQRVLSEVEARLYKGNLYRLLLDNPLFDVSENDELAAEVEQEIRSIIIGKLEELMGLSPSQIKTQSLPFTPEQITALTVLADKMIGKPSLMKASETPKLAVQEKKEPPASLRTVSVPVKKRGRPANTKNNSNVASEKLQTISKQTTEDKMVTKHVVDGKEVLVEHNMKKQVVAPEAKPQSLPSEQMMLAMGAAEAAQMENGIRNSSLGKVLNYITSTNKEE